MKETHVVPDVDGEEHDFEDCACLPALRQTDDGPIFTHNSFRKTGRYQIFEAALDASHRPEDTETADDEADTQWRRDEREIEGSFTGCEFPRLWPPRQRPASHRPEDTAEAAIERARAQMEELDGGTGIAVDLGLLDPPDLTVARHVTGKIRAALDTPSITESPCPRCEGSRIEPGSEDYDPAVHMHNPTTGEPCVLCNGAGSVPESRPGVRHEPPSPIYCRAEHLFGEHNEDTHICQGFPAHPGFGLGHACRCGFKWPLLAPESPESEETTDA